MRFVPKYRANVYPLHDFNYETEVHASDEWQAKRLIANRDNVEESRVFVAGEVKSPNSSASNSSSTSSPDTEWHIGHTITAALIGGTLLLAFAGEWFGMVLGGTAATWLGEKITGQTIDEYNSSVDTTEIQNKKIAYLLAIVLIGGGAGFAIGSNIKASINDSSDSQTQLHRDLHSELDA